MLFTIGLAATHHVVTTVPFAHRAVVSTVSPPSFILERDSQPQSDATSACTRLARMGTGCHDGPPITAGTSATARANACR